MKRILCYFLFFCVCIYMQAQTYDQLAARAVEAAERDSLELSEKLFEGTGKYAQFYAVFKFGDSATSVGKNR